MQKLESIIRDRIQMYAFLSMADERATRDFETFSTPHVLVFFRFALQKTLAALYQVNVCRVMRMTRESRASIMSLHYLTARAHNTTSERACRRNDEAELGSFSCDATRRTRRCC